MGKGEKRGEKKEMVNENEKKAKKDSLECGRHYFCSLEFDRK